MSRENKRIKLDPAAEAASNPRATRPPKGDPRSYEGRPFPHFSKPRQMGTFSVSIDRDYVDDQSELRAFSEPPVKCSLRDGYPDQFVSKDEAVREGLDFLLKWILLHDRDELHAKDGLDTFVTWRGHLSNIACSLYELKPWKFAVIRQGKRLYMSEYETSQAEAERVNRSDRHSEMCYWGIRFEAFATSKVTSKGTDDTHSFVPSAESSSDSEEEAEEVIDNCAGFCSVVCSRLNKHRLLFSGEVDCVRNAVEGENGPDPNEYIELKTSRLIETPAHLRTFERQALSCLHNC